MFFRRQTGHFWGSKKHLFSTLLALKITYYRRQMAKIAIFRKYTSFATRNSILVKIRPKLHFLARKNVKIYDICVFKFRIFLRFFDLKSVVLVGFLPKSSSLLQMTYIFEKLRFWTYGAKNTWFWGPTRSKKSVFLTPKNTRFGDEKTRFFNIIVVRFLQKSGSLSQITYIFQKSWFWSCRVKINRCWASKR